MADALRTPCGSSDDLEEERRGHDVVCSLIHLAGVGPLHIAGVGAMGESSRWSAAWFVVGALAGVAVLLAPRFGRVVMARPAPSLRVRSAARYHSGLLIDIEARVGGAGSAAWSVQHSAGESRAHATQTAGARDVVRLTAPLPDGAIPRAVIAEVAGRRHVVELEDERPDWTRAG